jgi:hypothetical protein
MTETVGFSENGAFLLELDYTVLYLMTGMLICTELVSVDACAGTREIIYGFVCRGIRNCD